MKPLQALLSFCRQYGDYGSFDEDERQRLLLPLLDHTQSDWTDEDSHQLLQFFMADEKDDYGVHFVFLLPLMLARSCPQHAPSMRYLYDIVLKEKEEELAKLLPNFYQYDTIRTAALGLLDLGYYPTMHAEIVHYLRSLRGRSLFKEYAPVLLATLPAGAERQQLIDELWQNCRRFSTDCLQGVIWAFAAMRPDSAEYFYHLLADDWYETLDSGGTGNAQATKQALSRYPLREKEWTRIESLCKDPRQLQKLLKVKSEK